jgi:hypothetical protein
MQPWNILKAYLTEDEFRGFMKGSAIVYLLRERDKGGNQDISKAEHYLKAMREYENRNKETSTDSSPDGKRQE